MTSLWTAEALRAATAGTGGASATGVSIDSRSVTPGDLFVALRDARDGHAFVADALARGAACAMVDRAPVGAMPDRAPVGATLRVADTMAGLIALGAAGRARFAGQVAAITGSVGKTGTKDMLRLMLSAIAPTVAAEASYNNHWGVPLTLARMPPDARFAAIEIGMNNPGEIAPLAALARPHVAAITRIGEAHVGRLGSLDAIAAEKGALLGALQPGGIAVLPCDSPFFPRFLEMAGGARILRFGRGAAAEVRLLDATADAGGTRVTIGAAGRQVRAAMPAVGLQHAENACCAIAMVAALGGDVSAAAAALSDYAPGAGRGAPRTIAVRGGTATLIDESYNAAPPAMQAALAALALRPGTRRIAVLGEMRELGDHAAALHAALAPAAAAADLVFCCGPDMAHLHAALPASRRGALAADSAALAPILRDALRPGDVVLVKGALGSRMAAVVQALTEGAA